MKIVNRVLLLLLMLLCALGTAVAGDIEPGTPAKLNLVVHYDYDETDPERIRPLLQSASNRLFDATEGQLEIGKVEIYVNCPANRPLADIVVHDTFGTAQAVVNGFGIRNAHIDLYSDHLLPPDLIGGDGSMSLVHELGHFLFGLMDEYQGQTVYTQLEPGIVEINVPEEVTDPSSAISGPMFFCTGENGFGSACIMNAGFDVNTGKTEFCTELHHTRHNKGVATNVTTKFLDSGEFGNLHLNDQHAKYYRDCWRVLQKSLEDRGVVISLPQAGADQGPTAASTVDLEVLKCAPAVALVLDVSGSMDGSRLSSMKSSAAQVVGLLEDGNKLSISVYSTNASVVFPMQALDAGNRATALSAITSLSASGSTNIGGGILSGLGQLEAQADRPEPGIIVLLTDGEHNTGTDPATAAAQVATADFTLQSVALGSNIDAAQLKTASEQTGGTLVVVENDEDLASAIVQQATAVQGDDVLLSQRLTIAPGSSLEIEIPVDVFARRCSTALSWDSGNLLTELVDPSGQTLNPASQDSNNSRVLTVGQPTEGVYRLKLTADQGNVADINVGAQVLVNSQDLSFAARVVRTGEFPAPIRIEAHSNAAGAAVADASVKAIIRDPEDNVQEIALFDDGNPRHGDLKAGDGSYTALFRRFVESGDYEIRIIIENVNGVTSTGVEFVEGFVPEPVSSFRREIRTSITIDDYQTLGAAGVEFTNDQPQLPDYSINTYSSEIYQLRFGLRTGAGEPVEVKSLEVTTTGTGDKSLVTGRLYIDYDNDGFIDSDGPGLQPVATGKFNLDTGVLDLGDGLVLEPDQEFNFILTYKVDLSGLLLMQAGIPLVLLLLSLLLVSRKRPVISAGLVGLFVLTVMGCSSQDDFVFRNTNVQQQSEATTPTGPIVIKAQSFQSRLINLTTEGAVTGSPVTVTNFQEIEGPQATIE